MYGKIAMRNLIFWVFLASAFPLHAQQYVEGYCKKNGVCVQGYFKTKPNGTAQDNYSSIGNLNPNTGHVSTKPLEIPATSGANSSQQQLQIGPKGGQYYINESGKKVYVH
jgi:streptogramin lyase